MTTGVRILENDGKVQIAASAGQTSLSFDFPIYSASHLRIIRTRAGVDTVLLITTDYTIPLASIGNESGGTAILNSGALAGDIYTLLLNVPYARVTDFTQAGDFFADTLNLELDLLAQQNQQIVRDAALGLRLPETSTVSVTLPAPEASKLLGWNSSANGMTNYALADLSGSVVSSYIQTLLDDADASTARATLGAASSSNAVSLTGTETLTNKTLTSPTISSPTISNANLTGTPTAPTPTAGDNSTKIATTAFVASAASALNVVQQVFTSSGTYTPTSGMKFCIVEAVGGGGGGGGGGANGNACGGGAGSYSMSRLTAVQIGASQTVTIGAGGNGGTVGNNGAAGGNTSLGSLVTTNGGGGGSIGSVGGNSLSTKGAAGGAIGTGNFTVKGGDGSASFIGTSAGGGNGGNSYFGAGGNGGAQNGGVNGSVGDAGAGGGGGAGQGAATGTGGNGGSGRIIITEFI